MDPYRFVPYLAILERRRDLLPKDLNSLPGELLEEAVKHLRDILYSKNPSLSPVGPSLFFVEANLVAFSPSRKVWERFALHYAKLALGLVDRVHHYRVRDPLPVAEFLSIERPFPELRLYHLPVERGRVFLGERKKLLAVSLLYNDILRWIEEKVRSIVLSGALDHLKDHAQRALQPPFRKRRGYPHIQRILEAVGIPDGRKRILFYWLIPYWVSVEGKTPEEVLDLANEWLSRQAGGKIYFSWILSEAENVRSKGIKPWSLQKVERIDPELVKMLRGMGIL
ncbi:MAG: DNA primase noncatalytic subunit PriX [Candidatus Diapherotrites archaeon]|nr:DNA primase noncatalytic subunit PriX [Candidatus Diapherotrites archaeon]